MEKVYCVFNQKEINKSDARQGFTVRDSIREIIKRRVPEFGGMVDRIDDHEFSIRHVLSPQYCKIN